MHSKSKKGFKIKDFIFLVFGIGALIISVIFLWLGTIDIPDLNTFNDRKIALSTKIYDRTGEVVLYDVHQDIKRTVVPFEEISTHVKNATVAIEDSEFYQHNGIRVKAIMRAVVRNITDGNLLGGQGGSTITQQVVKLTLLTKEKTITRKVKEWILAIKLEKTLSKEEILAIYLNEVPYGGNIYGIEEASQSFFSKPAKDLTLIESAYLASVIQVPTYYSPYGKNRDKLEERKNLVLSRMKDLSFITQEEYETTRAESIVFEREVSKGIKAPHFALYVKNYLENKYGEEAVQEGGLKVITTLDYRLQESAEEIVLRHALENKEKYNGENAGMVALNPRTGEILVMVGSRDYFDEEIDGKYNITLALRQPGSSFKPFVYASAFKEGFTPETILFDVKTEFNPSCNQSGNDNREQCYSPSNFDSGFRGPMTLRNALSQSINIPAVKLLYLVGVNDAIKTAREMGITTLADGSRYGLSLVLGGGEVRLLDMVSAYSVFANKGVLNPYQSILKVEDIHGRVLEEFSPSPRSVLPEDVALTISSILDDDVTRAPTFGSGSSMNFGSRNVAAKTGTTNDYRDAWIIGYTPSIAVGVWIGNNDNTSMQNRPSAGSLWREFMNTALQVVPVEVFEEPLPHPEYDNLKTVFRGIWFSETDNEITTIHSINPHSFLYYADKNDIHGESPRESSTDSQFDHWEFGIKEWWLDTKYKYRIGNNGPEPIPGL